MFSDIKKSHSIENKCITVILFCKKICKSVTSAHYPIDNLEQYKNNLSSKYFMRRDMIRRVDVMSVSTSIRPPPALGRECDLGYAAQGGLVCGGASR
jgi:hypothetical protein